MGKINDLLKNLNLNEDKNDDIKEIIQELKRVFNDTDKNLDKYDVLKYLLEFYVSLKNAYAEKDIKKLDYIKNEGFDKTIDYLENSLDVYEKTINNTITKLKTLKDTYSKLQ
jgi:hypothetical protein